MKKESDILIERHQFLLVVANNAYNPDAEEVFRIAEINTDPEAFWKTIQDAEIYYNCYRGIMTDEDVCEAVSQEDNVVLVYRISITGDNSIIEDITEEVAKKYIEINELEYNVEELHEEPDPFIRDSEAYDILRRDYEREANTRGYDTSYEYFPPREHTKDDQEL